MIYSTWYTEELLRLIGKLVTERDQIIIERDRAIAFFENEQRNHKQSIDAWRKDEAEVARLQEFEAMYKDLCR